MRRYLTKADTREGKYACAKEGANAQGQIRARAGAMVVRGTAKGELRTGNCEGGRVLMTTDGNSQT